MVRDAVLRTAPRHEALELAFGEIECQDEACDWSGFTVWPGGAARPAMT